MCVLMLERVWLHLYFVILVAASTKCSQHFSVLSRKKIVCSCDEI